MSGRPLLKGGRKKPVTVLLRPKVEAQVRAAARNSDVSVSKFIAMLVNDHFMSEARERVGDGQAPILFSKRNIGTDVIHRVLRLSLRETFAC